MPPKGKSGKESTKTTQQKTLNFNSHATARARDHQQDNSDRTDDEEQSRTTDKMHDHGKGEFEQFVKATLQRMEEKIDKAANEQKHFRERLVSIEEKQDNFEKSLEHSAKDIDELKNDHVVTEKRIKDLELIIQALDSKLKTTTEENIRLQRYSRSFNLRFGGIQEREGENCTQILADLLEDKLGFENATAMLENAHRARTGKATANRRRGAGQPSHIIVKFMKRPERLKVLMKARRALEGSGIFVTEDLCPSDYKRKCELGDVMKKAYEQGKRPRFVNGKLYINGQQYD